MPRKPRGQGPKMPFHPDEVRMKIRAMRMVDLLHQHIEGTRELSSSQIKACEILLRKVVPDLSTTTVNGEVNVRYVVELPAMLTRAEWLAKYSHDHLDLKPEPPAINGNGGGSH